MSGLEFYRALRQRCELARRCRRSSETFVRLQTARNSSGAWDACDALDTGRDSFLADDGDNDGDEQPAKKVQRQTEGNETSEWARSARAALGGRRSCVYRA